MAIFAKKKDGRREKPRSGDSTDGEAAEKAQEKQNESVHLDVPDQHKDDAVLTKANLPEAQAAAAAIEAKAEDTSKAENDNRDDNNDGSVDVDVHASAPKADATPAAAAAAPAESPIEPVEIEPEVIEAPVEVPLVFGIADAIRLMRSLPADPNIDLVVRVVRVTLSAVNVSVEDIMRDAEKKEKRVRESIAVLESEVTDLEKRLHEKRSAIASHQADLRETATVRERLHMADKYTPHPPPLPPGAARIPLPKPREWESFDSDVPLKE